MKTVRTDRTKALEALGKFGKSQDKQDLEIDDQASRQVMTTQRVDELASQEVGLPPVLEPVPMPEKWIKFGTHLPEDLKRKLNIKCAEKDLEIRHAVRDAIEQWLKKA